MVLLAVSARAGFVIPVVPGLLDWYARLIILGLGPSQPGHEPWS